MEWIQSITNAIRYIEVNLTNNISIDDVSNHVFVSGTHFQRIFNVVKLRFIGLDLKANPGISIENTIKKISPLLNPLKPEYAWEITDYCYLEHHGGGEVNVNETGIGGWFFKADTPVPEGCIYYDIPTVNIGYGIYCGDENFGGDTFDAYTFTRDQILSDGVIIPYPEAYWTAVLFIDGEPQKGKYRFGYIFGIMSLISSDVFKSGGYDV